MSTKFGWKLIPCPKCGVEAGEPCKMPRGSYALAHRVRLDASAHIKKSNYLTQQGKGRAPSFPHFPMDYRRNLSAYCKQGCHAQCGGKKLAFGGNYGPRHFVSCECLCHSILDGAVDAP